MPVFGKITKEKKVIIMLKNKFKALVIIPMAMVLIEMLLCSCGTVSQGSSAGSAHVETSTPAAESQDVHSYDQPAQESSSSHSSVRDRFRDVFRNASDSEQPSEPVLETASENDPYGIEEIARIGSLEADVETKKNLCIVDTEDEHNPYDVVWDYGKDYDELVDAVNDAGLWDVLFDFDFYKEHYPMLALQYHDREDLLLEHFQTVGIHEGRQGSDAFNIAAYMENCDSSLVSAFGEDYACYYLYWALHQSTEAKVDTKSDGHPVQMTVKLTALQAAELRGVNRYREDAGVDPIGIDPEFMALGTYRAWLDYTGDYHAHEWMEEHYWDDFHPYVKSIGGQTYSENTVQKNDTNNPGAVGNYAASYASSESHYKAMVSKKYTVIACTNLYFGPNEKGRYKECQYDVFLNATDNANMPEGWSY